MSFRAFNQGANVVSYRKDNRDYAMTCAWAMMVDYDRIMMVLGEQSATGNNIKIGDIIGVSSLSESQKEIALQLGDLHSDQVDKLVNIKIKREGTAILIENAKVQMTVEITDILHLKENPHDNLIYGRILNHQTSKEGKFLSYDCFE